jgi:ribosomal protein S27AE
VHNSKECFKCLIVKPITEFYKHKGMADGHLNKCKECSRKDTKDNIAKNREYYREYEANRANLPKRVEARLRYSQTTEGKEAHRRAKEKWESDNLIKRAACCLVNNALRSGRLIKKNECEECGVNNGRIHGHHDDYDYPLIVRWLCPKCHTKWHKENGSGING